MHGRPAVHSFASVRPQRPKPGQYKGLESRDIRLPNQLGIRVYIYIHDTELSLGKLSNLVPEAHVGPQ